MKNVRIFMIATLLIFMVTGMMAQTIGVKAGLNLSNMMMKMGDETLSEEYKMIPGFHAGVIADIPVTKMFSIEAGALVSTKGYKLVEEIFLSDEKMEIDLSMNLIYIDVPITAKGTIDIGLAKVYGAVGPYLAYGVAGKTKTEVTIMGVTEKDEEDVVWGTEEDDQLKPFDFGLTAGAGVEFKGFFIGVSYEYGLANLSTYSDDDSVINNRVLGISVGYLFGNK
jgi:hypothetical protein